MNANYSYNFLSLMKFEKLRRQWALKTAKDLNDYLDKNDFDKNIEKVYLDTSKFIKNNEDEKLLDNFGILLLWEFMTKTVINTIMGIPISNENNIEIDQEVINKLIFNMATVNNFRITLISDINEWIITRFEFVNQNAIHNKKISKSELKKVKKFPKKFNKFVKKYFDLKDEIQINVYDDIRFTLNQSIETGIKYLKNTRDGEKFIRI